MSSAIVRFRACAIAALCIAATGPSWAQPHLVRDVRPGPAWSWPTSFAVVSGRLVFVADDGVNGAEPWSSDGSSAAMVYDFVPVPGPAYPSWGDVGGGLAVAAAPYYLAGSARGNELFVSNLTPGGTSLLAELCPGSCTGVYGPIVPVGPGPAGVCVFVASTPGGQRLWRTDGSAAGTYEIADFVPGSVSEDLGVARGRDGFALVSVRGPSGEQLWRTSGAPAGQTLLFHPGAPSAGGGVSATFFWNGSLFAVADDLVHPRQSLFEVDVNGAGATFRQSLTAEPQFNAFIVTSGAPSGSRAFMRVYELTTNFEPIADSMWAVESPSDPPVELVRIPIASSVNALGLQGLRATRGGAGGRGRLLWTNEPVDNQTELWTSDGTPQGTHRLATFQEADLNFAITLGNYVIFSADDGVHGGELWITDGTVPGTRLAVEINPGPATGTAISEINWQYSEFAVVGDQLFFNGNDGVSGFEPWVWRHPLLADRNNNGAPDFEDLSAGVLHDANHDALADEFQCLGDWNGSGGAPSVDDIFAFLSGYFSDDADANHDGATSVQDVFVYLVLYFSGCV